MVFLNPQRERESTINHEGFRLAIREEEKKKEEAEMSSRSIVRDGLGSLSRGGSESRVAQALKEKKKRQQQEEELEGKEEMRQAGCWAGGLPPELLRDIISAWPARRHVVACAAVCRSWRQTCKEVVSAPELCAKLTFPVSLKQPGPRSGLIQCYIKRNKGASTYNLFVGLSPENGKFLVAAKKIRHPTRAEYIISMDTEDISRNSTSYMGKLRSNLLGTKFDLYDSQPPLGGAMMPTGRSNRRLYSRKASPKVPVGSYGIAHIAYELNMLGTRGPRRMYCTMHSIPSSALEAGGCVPYHTEFPHSIEESFSTISLSHSMEHIVGRELGPTDPFASSARFSEICVDVLGKESPLMLKNKSPRWHEQLQCWCLNFRGRVTVASVKNFQLIAAVEAIEPARAAGTSQGNGGSEHEKILLQFGKIGKDIFTMDYHYPLSAFQAFGICLSSFDTKVGLPIKFYEMYTVSFLGFVMVDYKCCTKNYLGNWWGNRLCMPEMNKTDWRILVCCFLAMGCFGGFVFLWSRCIYFDDERNESTNLLLVC